MSTYFPKGEIARKWYVVDADGQTLGRLSSRVARILSGKDNPRYTPFLDTGDHVVVINAAKVKLTGLKAGSKVYRRYTGFPGGLREEEFTKRLAADLACQQSQDTVKTTVHLYLCRDRVATLLHVLAPNSLVVIGRRRRWWPTAETRLAKVLRSNGHQVVSIDWK